MKMTREQVAELLLKADLDCRNLEYLDNGEWKPTLKNYIGHILQNIVNGYVYRIKDNSVKEVTPALLGAKCKFRTADYYAIIIAVDTTNERIYLPHDNEMGLTQFNNDWQLVED